MHEELKTLSKKPGLPNLIVSVFETECIKLFLYPSVQEAKWSTLTLRLFLPIGLGLGKEDCDISFNATSVTLHQRWAGLGKS